VPRTFLPLLCPCYSTVCFLQLFKISKEQLIQEVEDLRRKIAELEKSETERKRAEEVIQENLRFRQLLIDTIPSPIFYKDAEGIYRGGNKALEKLWGRPLDDIIGKTVYDISPSDLAEIYERADNDLLNNPGVQVYETSVASSEGKRRNVIFNKATFTNDEGKVAGLIGVIVDITDRKMAEEALQRAHDGLEQCVAVRTEELRQTNEELQS
jgi:PAS domain S-box-containing protein